MRFFLILLVLCESLCACAPNQEHFPVNPTGPNQIGYIYIGDHSSEINQGTWIYVKNALDHYKATKPAFIILELDTPGGQIFAAQKIASALKEMDTQYHIPVVALINNWAISAGALLAYSCRTIAITKDASMGAAEPITSSGEATSEKVHSAIRADFANAAGFFDRNSILAEAMVDADLIVVSREGEIIQLGKEEEIQKSDKVISRKGKLLTLNAKEMMDLGVADLFLPPVALPPLTAAEKKEGRWPASKNLLFTSTFFQEIPQATIEKYHMDWKTQFFSFLSSSWVTSLLVLALMISIYMELSHPGLGVPAVLGLVALSLLILSSFSMAAFGYLEVILLGAGLLLLLLEIFVIPGFGITGIVGILLLLAGLLGLLLPGLREFDFDVTTKTLNAAGLYLLERIAWIAGALLIGASAIAVLSRYFSPTIALYSPLILRGEQTKEKGFVAGIEKEKLPLVGSLGIAFTPLRKGGRIKMDGEIFEAMSSGKFIDKGAKIRVVEIVGNKVIVEEVES